jgi:hypothetical protein
MRTVLESLLGVPATIFLAGGLGIIAVTVASWIRPRSRRGPIGWAHFTLGVALAGIGVALLGVELTLMSPQ